MKKIVFLINLLCVVGVVAAQNNTCVIDGTEYNFTGSTAMEILDRFVSHNQGLHRFAAGHSRTFLQASFNPAVPFKDNDSRKVSSIVDGESSFGRGLAYYCRGLKASEVGFEDGSSEKDVDTYEM